MLEDFDGALMVYCPDEEYGAIVWKGGDSLVLITENGQVDLKTYMDSIKDVRDAIEKAEAWLEDIKAGDYYDDNMDGDHDSALASAGWGTDEDYGG